MTVVQMILLLVGGMPLFDSIVHSFGTAGTGGFGIKSDSITSYNSYCQWVITVFMILFGVNFNLYYLMHIKRFKPIFKSTELWTYLGIVFVSCILIALNISPLYTTFEDVGTTVADSFNTVFGFCYYIRAANLLVLLSILFPSHFLTHANIFRVPLEDS